MRRRRLGTQKDSGKIEEPFREDAVCPRSTRASQVAPVVKNPPANAGDVKRCVLSLGRDEPFEKSKTPHSSILAWRIPCTEEPGGLQSIGLQRVRHDWNDLACMQKSTKEVWMSLWLGPRERKGGVQRGMRVRHHEAAPEMYGHITHVGFSMFGLHPQTKMGVYLCLLIVSARRHTWDLLQV